MFLQPILGALHHMSFKRQGRRGALSHVHVWYGRALMILGIINGGLGLQLASAGMPLRMAYIVLSAIIGVPYFLAVPWSEWRKARASKGRTSKAQTAGMASDETASR